MNNDLSNNLLIRPEAPSDAEAIRTVNRRAFESDVEPELVDRLRIGGWARLSLVAELDGEVVGHILFSPLRIVSDGSEAAAMALAPMAVLPEHQRSGIGSALVREGLRRLKERGEPAVIVLGHRDYYPRFGFSPELARKLESPYAGDSFMALELIPESLPAGRVIYAPPFDDV